MIQRRLSRLGSTLSCLGVALALCSLVPDLSRASCGFETVGKAKGYRLTFTRAFVPCGAISPWVPNVSTKGGVPGCALPVPSSSFEFSDKGRCTLNLRQVAESACKQGNSGADCSSLRIRAGCSGVLSPDGQPTAAVNWRLRLTFRATVDDETLGPMTVVESPLTLTFPPPLPGELGKLVLTGRVPTCDLINSEACLEQFSACTSLELLSATIVDPGGDTFASAGTASR